MDHFSWIAPYYDRIFRRARVDPLFSWVEAESHHRLLDVGGGTGRVSQSLVGLVAQVVVLDPSTGMVREGQRKGLCIAQGEAEHLPFRNGAFDRVIAVDSFHHMRDQRLAAQELLRVLAPGGRLVIEEPDIAGFWVKLAAIAEKLAMMRSHFLPLEVLASWFETAGGQVLVERRGYVGWVIVEGMR